MTKTKKAKAPVKLSKTGRISKKLKKIPVKAKKVAKPILRANMINVPNSDLAAAALNLDYVVRTWNRQNPDNVIGRYVVRLAQSHLGPKVPREKLLEYIGQTRG